MNMKMKKPLNNRETKYSKYGQSSLEYAALITVMAGVILSVVWLSTGNSVFQQSLQSAFTTVADKLVFDIESIR